MKWYAPIQRAKLYARLLDHKGEFVYCAPTTSPPIPHFTEAHYVVHGPMMHTQKLEATASVQVEASIPY